MKKLFVITLLLMVSGIGRAHKNDLTGRYWKPMADETTHHSKSILAQQNEYKAANEAFKASHSKADFDKAWDAAMFPVQRAWLCDNWVFYHLTADASQDSLNDLASTARNGLRFCSEDAPHKNGSKGTGVCKKKLESLLSAIEDRLAD